MLTRDDNRRPSLATVLLLERKLNRQPCFGEIGRWDRRFGHSFDRAQRLSENVINFSMMRAPRQTRGRRQVVTWGEVNQLDDSQFYAVNGQFLIGSGKVTISYCGLNHPDLPPNWQPPG